ncbi:MAG: hypothetical protein KKA62_00085 [Nanoarchaeota archaeon]|nr:hypothetical protein [Nanoarchaeota archaeon]MBU1644220.1 hypothetical protein [Nanoarchaeota archaeon]MBU1976335.1 hypothetical protein [Nanoarchaeota archaeon]
MKNKTALKLMLLLSLLGIIASLYLVQNHYAPPTKGSFCDISSSISCSLVNNSVFAELLNVPVAILGVVWFVFLTIMLLNNTKKEGLFVAAVFWWSAIGLLFVGYMILAEIILKALCPLCTIVHLIVVFNFLLAVRFYRTIGTRPKIDTLLRKMKWWIIVFVVVVIALVVALNLGEKKNNYDLLAQCLSEKGATIYSSFRCGHCLQQKELLGDSVRFIKEVECNPDGENSQIKLCEEKEITGTPTWVIEKNGIEIKRHAGYMTIEELKEFSGCE